MVHRRAQVPFSGHIVAQLRANCVPTVSRAGSGLEPSPEGDRVKSEAWAAKCRVAGRLHGSRGSYDTHSVLSRRNSLRKAGQRKRENQPFFCTTVIFLEVLIGAAALEASAFARVIDIKLIVIRRVDRCSRATKRYDFRSKRNCFDGSANSNCSP
jgi:hypothetical protein